MQTRRPLNPSPVASAAAPGRTRESRLLRLSINLNITLAGVALLLGIVLVKKHWTTSDADPRAAAAVTKTVSGKKNPAQRKPSATLSRSDAARARLTRTDSVFLDAINTGDATSLLATLRKTGMDEADVHQLVRVAAQFKLNREQREAMNALSASVPWWQDARLLDDPEYLQLQKDFRQKRKDLNAELNALLGPDPRRVENLRRQFPFLSAEKIDQMLQVQADYGELRSSSWEQAGGFRTATDKGGFDLLKTEEKRDMEALLAPDERVKYYAAQSYRLRNDATLYNLSESEVLQLGALQKTFEEQFPSGVKPANDAERELRRQARAQLDAARDAILTDDRLDKTLVARRTSDYSLLERAVERFNLPAETPARVFSLRDEVAQKSRQIASDSSLDDKGKKAALAALAGETRERIHRTLGGEIASAYFDNNGMDWLKEVEKGKSVEFDKKSGEPKTRPLPAPPKKKK